jgi:Xaa-Pro aminopeptidase
MLEKGAEGISFDTIALAGENTSMPHGVPSDKKVKNGEFVLMDFGAVYNGYHSDMTRTVCVGTPDEEMEKIYNIVLTAQEKAIAAAKAGISGKELDGIARRHICDAGYGEYFGHSLGHGVGLEIHERPNLSPMSEKILVPGNIVTVEPGIYIPDKYGCRIEDMVLITENGIMNFTKSPKELIEIY